MRQVFRVLIGLGMLISGGATAQDADFYDIELSGTWRLAMDPEDVGLAQTWYKRIFLEPVTLPGALRDSGYGDPITLDTQWMSRLHDPYWFQRKAFAAYTVPGQVKIPFWLQPELKYTGVAWYQCDVNVPVAWQGRRTVVSFERTHWSTMLWLDALLKGSSDSLGTAHEYDLGRLTPGRHTLTVRVDNRYLQPIREDAHAITDHTQSNWHGLAGRLHLFNTSAVWLRQVRAFTDIERRSVRLDIRIGNLTGQAGQGTVTCGSHRQSVTWTDQGGTAALEVSLGKDAGLWDEFTPTLHPLTVTLKGEGADDQHTLNVGLRKMESRDARFFINGRRLFFRGTNESCLFPWTGYPPVDVPSWKAVFNVVKAYGLNHVRFHSWCPPEAAFAAADELGVYLQPECSNWGQYSDRDTRMPEFLQREAEAIIDAYGNHPSFVMLSSGNEPAGPWAAPLLAWCDAWKKQDPRRLYASQTGRTFSSTPGPMDTIDYLIAIRFGSLRFRGDQAWHGGDWRQSLEGTNTPVISHETGQWCAFPDFSEIPLYTGALRANNLEIFRDSVAAHGLWDRAHAFLMASGAFQVACYKEDIEALLRTPGMGGFQLLDLHDFSGQGTALVGVLNVFWQSKGYVTPRAFRRFCSETVPLARMTQTLYTSDDTLTIPVEIAHFGARPLSQAVPQWRIEDESGHVVAEGQWPVQDIAIGNGLPLGTVTTPLVSFKAPQQYTLYVGLADSTVENDWHFWVYPPSLPQEPASDILVTSSLTDAQRALAAGGKVLWIPAYQDLPWNCPPVGRLPVFWNGLMGPRWERSLGLVCDPNHPALAAFPTDSFMDWQWQNVLEPTCRAINIEALTNSLQPIVQVIDDWNRNYKLALVFEGRVGTGRVVVCSADLVTDLDSRPVARQLRHSLLHYMASDRFAPSDDITPDQLAGLFFDNLIMQRLGTIASETGPSRRTAGAYAVDGNPNTIWSSGNGQNGSAHPHALTLAFARPVSMTGLVMMPVQNDRRHTGDIREYRVEVSADGTDWIQIVQGEWASTFNPQTTLFGTVVTAKHLRLTALSGFGEDQTAALAELAVILSRP
ncbi:MAG: discoidin domain-containing protein [Phycisphaerae bacterium]|nr:discoidin domain-containing protein [Phycisphaerae bacterium]